MAQKNAKNNPAEKLLGWKDLPIGGIIPSPGNSEKYITGTWNPGRVLWLNENCTNCGMCFMACPDSAILHDENGKMIGIDQNHCKRCGLCIKSCNFNALKMEE